MSEIPKSKCFMCLNIYNSNNIIPLILPCGHTFCDKCIKNEYNKKNYFICKFCDKKIYTHYSEFTKNEYILSLIDKKMLSNEFCDIKYIKNLKKINQIWYNFTNNEFDDLLHPKPKPKPKIPSTEIKKDIKEEKKEEIKEEKKTYSKITNNSFNDDSHNKTIDTNLSSTFQKKNNMKYSNNKAAKKKTIEYFIKPTNQEYSQLFNYFEVIKNILKYNDKFKNVGKIGKFIKIIYQPTIIIFFLILHYFLLLYNFEFGLFYTFVCILYVNENNIYDIVLKVKMFTAFASLLLLEDLIYKLGISHLSSFTLFYNFLIGSRTIYAIFVLGNELTLNTIISKILWIMSLGNLLHK